jgi:hypothetical protein
MIKCLIKLDPNYFKNNNALPLARIKKIMKLDDEVKVKLYKLYKYIYIKTLR